MWTYTLPLECPPKEARKEDVKVFRLVETIPSTGQDWVPLALEQKMNPPKTPHQDFDAFKDCCAHG
ncbi:hypothetical protein Q8W27_17355, partial [Oceanobacter sp. 2_MG-2023]